jgi:hypothetical protein
MDFESLKADFSGQKFGFSGRKFGFLDEKVHFQHPYFLLGLGLRLIQAQKTPGSKGKVFGLEN